MMQSNDSAIIDQHIAAELVNVVTRSSRHPASQHEPQINTPVLRSPNLPKTTAVHPIRPINRPGTIDKQRPGEIRFSDIRFCPFWSFERHGGDL